MNSKKNHSLFFLAKFPLLLLYVSFFTVQLFYNFEIANHALPLSFHQYVAQKDKPLSALKKLTKPVDKKKGFRLNKRYQPEQAVTCHPIIINNIVCYVSSKLHVHYSSGFVPSSFPPAHALRGPPAVA